MKSYCQYCERLLRLWEMKCPYCQRRAMSWLHIGVISALAVTTALYLFKNF
ncbi:MAG TPA: hypothetical protein VNA19_02850 [Pyrinomonadaceae bacterium]|jgi:RNA polymerase subunit RPABC4/transcription elongation factor Spt4|nr:hypothetical protein [Pyrinomonadaceae bacterium]